jgi:hypothetical protein
LALRNDCCARVRRFKQAICTGHSKALRRLPQTARHRGANLCKNPWARACLVPWPPQSGHSVAAPSLPEPPHRGHLPALVRPVPSHVLHGS